MKNKILLTAYCLLFTVYYAVAQTDEYWTFRKSALDFNSGAGLIDTNNSCNVIMGICQSSICTNKNKLLFYSNGYNVYNRNNSWLPNGFHFNHSAYGDIYINGNANYPVMKGAIFIPFVNDSNKFYMFYQDLEYEEQPSNNLLPSKLRVLVIDKSLNNGLGDIVFKDSTVISGDTLINGNLYATRNGNGKDWWLITKKYHSNKYFVIKIDSNGISHPLIQNVGTPYTTPYTYPATGDISMNGDKLTYLNISLNGLNGQLDLLDFDRCSGLLSNPQTEIIPYISNGDTLALWTSSFSPNGKYIYISSGIHLWQLNLNSSNLLNSRIKVGTWDGSHTPNASYFYQMKNGNDSKTYVSCYGSNSYIHVINKPDSFGLACNFIQKQILVGNYPNHFQDGSFPNTPNYKLGSINCNVGIENIGTEANGLNIYPNPTNSSLTISSNQTIKSITVYDLVGKEILNAVIHKKSENISLTAYSNGLYFIKAINENGEIFTKKIVKE